MTVLNLSAQQIRVSTNSNTKNVEIRTANLGIILPPLGKTKGSKLLSPIQSLIYKDGTVTDNSPNYLESDSRLSEMQVSIREQKANVLVAQVLYYFESKTHRWFKKDTKMPVPNDRGYYSFTVTLEKEAKSILIEEEGNCNVGHYTKISTGLLPDRGRYRGWQAYDVTTGYEPDGKIYRPEEARGYPLDATIDLKYDKINIYPRLIAWEPAGGENGSGRYWQFYNNRADENANLFGLFQGRPSRLLNAGGSIGPNIRTFPKDPQSGETNDAELEIGFSQQWPNDRWVRTKRFQWGIFISTKKDLLSPEKTQPIAQELNRVSGLGSVIKQYASDPVVLAPSFVKGVIYFSSDELEMLRTRIKNEEDFYKYIVSTEGFYKPVWDSWRFTDSARALLDQMLKLPAELVEQYTNGEGTFHNFTRYWKGARSFKFYAISVAALLVNPELRISAQEKKSLYQLIGLMAKIVWDDNNVPAFDSAGVNMGPGNMYFQYKNNARAFFALLLAPDPSFKKRARDIIKGIETDINNAVYKNGSSFGSPHYIQAAIDPILFSILQARQAGLDISKESEEKLVSFSKFYCTLLTPPSVRFENNRKLISFGDGSEESAATFGLLASILKRSHPVLSKQLSNIFHNGPPRSSFASPIMLAVDLASPVPNEAYNYSVANYAGYLSNFRTAANTRFESALWVLNGDDYFDHRNDDAGEMAIYALGAPLSLSRSSFYYPAATDAKIRSMVVPENLFPEWNRDQQPISGNAQVNRTWIKSDPVDFANLGYVSTTTIKMKGWNDNFWFRTVTSIAIKEDKPIFLFKDSVTGNAFNIWSMLMMSEGNVSTPVGPMNPIKRLYNNNDLKQLPVSSSTRQVNIGWNRFGFTGQTWKNHVAGGINWALYTFQNTTANFALAHWGTAWQNIVEQEEFRRSNGRQYTEEQQILRIQCRNSFYGILIPYIKGDEAYEKKIDLSPDKKLTIKQDELLLTILEDGVLVSKPLGEVLVGFNGKRMQGNSFTVEGGPIAINKQQRLVYIRIHGKTGLRKITTKHILKLQNPATGLTINRSNGITLISIDYKNEKLNLTSGEKGYVEYIFSILD